MCGVLFASSALGAIAFHARVSEAIAGPAIEPITVAAPITAEIAQVTTATTHQPALPIDRADPRAYGFVVEIGGATYVQLSTDDDEVSAPRTGRAHLAHDDGAFDAYASVAASQLPARLHDWIGKRVMVDGTCAANVVGFAKIARLSGDTAYAGVSGPDADDPHAPNQWTAATVMEHGATMLAAKLDRCTGTWARDAALPPAIAAIPLPSNRGARRGGATVTSS